MIKNIVLIGLMGTGKTTIAHALAKERGWESLDTDQLIELRAGKTIKAMFAEEGEPVFRNWETRILEELQPTTRTVIATGGGIVLRDLNRPLLKSLGTVIWLQACPETIVARISGDESRPLLYGDDQEKAHRLGIILEARTEMYTEAADYCVSTEGITPEAVVQTIREICFA